MTDGYYFKREEIDVKGIDLDIALIPFTDRRCEGYDVVFYIPTHDGIDIPNMVWDNITTLKLKFDEVFDNVKTVAVRHGLTNLYGEDFHTTFFDDFITNNILIIGFSKRIRMEIKNVLTNRKSRIWHLAKKEKYLSLKILNALIYEKRVVYQENQKKNNQMELICVD